MHPSAANIVQSVTELSAINERLNIFEDLLEQEPYSSSDYIPTINILIMTMRKVHVSQTRAGHPVLTSVVEVRQNASKRTRPTVETTGRADFRPSQGMP